MSRAQAKKHFRHEQHRKSLADPSTFYEVKECRFSMPFSLQDKPDESSNGPSEQQDKQTLDSLLGAFDVLIQMDLAQKNKDKWAVDEMSEACSD